MRAFIGIPLTDPLCKTLRAVAVAVCDASPGWGGEKWVLDENLHITLRFLGEIDVADVERARSVLDNVARIREPYLCELADIVARPRSRAASMLWARVADHGETAALAADLADAIGDAERKPSERAFVPHVTLVRARRPRALSAEALDAAVSELARAGRDGAAMSVTHVTLYRSTLTRTGPVYETLADLALGRD